MAITYPLNTPTNIGIANITLMAESAVAVSQSPFTFSQQVVAHPGQRWAASISLPPMKRQDAENWIAFLLSLKGQVGTFLLGDPNAVNPQGSASTRRNLFNYTEQIDNAYWTKGNFDVTANATTAPDGTLTAESLIETNATVGVHRFYRTITIPTGVHTFSFYVKPNGRSWVYIYANTGVSNAYVNITTGALGTVTGATVVTTSVGNGWYRVAMTYNNLTVVSQTLQIWTALANGNNGQTGDGVSGAYFWGIQLEAGDTTAYQGVVDTYGPLVNGASQTGSSLNIDGCSPSNASFLSPGDYIQLGSGSATQLYKVLTTTASNASGQATVDIWPNLRSSPADNAAVTVVNTKGKFRLKDNVTQWGINEISSYGITFDCVEAL